ncbi:hypothetical protein A9G24_07440 [Gilliamella sp. App6-5]|uniref:hypothetical protein n=1 Tax=Gilliamella sp. App6-5 TaxID=3120232 RepID=UPI00080E6D1C|nr:hypothetical protein [Gilliamella apicola]OCG13700.1 hypothetical protein A9G24_07440 [Gilliamella apicola]
MFWFYLIFPCVFLRFLCWQKQFCHQGMQQEIVIDVSGQHLSSLQEFKIIRGIVRKSNGIIKREHITFKSE